MPSGHWCIVGKKQQFKKSGKHLLYHAHHAFHIIKSEVTGTLLNYTSITCLICEHANELWKWNIILTHAVRRCVQISCSLGWNRQRKARENPRIKCCWRVRTEVLKCLIVESKYRLDVLPARIRSSCGRPGEFCQTCSYMPPRLWPAACV